MSAALARAVAAPVALRRARADDCERIWEWNFAPDVRALSRDPRVVTFQDHARWFAARLADVGAPLWVIEEGGVAAGVVRLDRLPDERGRISIALPARARGRGLGRQAITAACELWARPVVAEILPTNTASRACFEACGFVVTATTDLLLTYQWSP